MAARTVCIVEDDGPVRDSLRMVLERRGLRVWGYASASAFLKQANTDCGCFLFDNQLPELSGIELLEVLRARQIGTPAIIMTAGIDLQLVERARRAGAMAVLTKPMKLDETLAAIARAFE